MLAFLGNLGSLEILVIVLIAVLIFGKDLPQAASKVYLQARKFRSAVDDLRRDSGIDRELRDIERTVREAEWEARRKEVPPPRALGPSGPPAPPPAAPPGPAAPQAPTIERTPERAPDEDPPRAPTDAAS